MDGIGVLDRFHSGEGSGGNVYCHPQQSCAGVFDGFFSLNYSSGVKIY
jgi:hypothetical protein